MLCTKSDCKLKTDFYDYFTRNRDKILKVKDKHEFYRKSPKYFGSI